MRVFDFIGEMGIMYKLMPITNVRARIERNERVIKKSEEERSRMLYRLIMPKKENIKNIELMLNTSL
jgi:hypothetical protein